MGLGTGDEHKDHITRKQKCSGERLAIYQPCHKHHI